MGGGARFPGCCDEQQMDWRFDNPALWNANESAVLKKGGVERRERAFIAARVTREVFLDQRRVAGERRGEAGQDNPLPLSAGRRELRRIMAVDKYQARLGCLAESESGNRVGAQAVPPDLEHRLEGQFGYGRDVGESPILILECREPDFCEARNARLAQAGNPGRLLGFLFETFEP